MSAIRKVPSWYHLDKKKFALSCVVWILMMAIRSHPLQRSCSFGAFFIAKHQIIALFCRFLFTAPVTLFLRRIKTQNTFTNVENALKATSEIETTDARSLETSSIEALVYNNDHVTLPRWFSFMKKNILSRRKEFEISDASMLPLFNVARLTSVWFLLPKRADIHFLHSSCACSLICSS